jgi:Ca2+-transporting ATPase
VGVLALLYLPPTAYFNEEVGAMDKLPPTRPLRCGDRIVLASGDVVPADCRLLECRNLRIQEAALTGGSEPADKRPDPSGADGYSPCDPCAMAFMGTRVVGGEGLAEVVATGAQTRWAQIATLSQVVQRKPPPRRYREVEQAMTTLLLALVGLLLLLGLLHILRTLAAAGLPAALGAG